MEFTAHNILLDNGQRTIYDHRKLLAETDQCRAIICTLNTFFGGQDKSKVRIADLGCFEGGYTVEFARNGYDALGIEARRLNLENCYYVAKNLNLPNLKFVKDDVKNIANYGIFDVIFCCGLLYHLDQPYAFLKTLGQMTRSMLILHTHYSVGKPNFFFPPAEPTYLENLYRIYRYKILATLRDMLPKKLRGTKRDHNLSHLAINEGKLGRWFYEYDPISTKEDIEKQRLNSYSNEKSFWMTKKELLQSVKESGFDLIYEQYDFLGDIVKNTYTEDCNRGLFIGVKSR
ncbi:MAG: methyltransferase domain-containing protein [Candidatus Omnitrophica bacterium]|nr:methyltransferase domain-containing protein [Candidatus Omnitrophota bacterium]